MPGALSSNIKNEIFFGCFLSKTFQENSKIEVSDILVCGFRHSDLVLALWDSGLG